MKNMNIYGKKVLVMGLGLHGGGVAVIQWLLKHGAKVTVTDLKTEKELQTSLDKLRNLKVRYILGRHRAEDFKKTDILVQSPAVPNNSKYLKIAQKSGVEIENDASLFFKHCKGLIIGVTGTRGKSTTSTLIYELLKTKTKKVYLAGLSQKPEMEILDKIRQGDLAVLELSSWQLEILGKEKLSPHVAVITNVYPDHLNRYSGMDSYIKAKKNIFENQTRSDFAILNLGNPETKKIGKTVLARRFWFSQKYFSEQNGCFVKNGKIIFRHDGKETELAKAPEKNLENLLAALTVAGVAKVSPAKIKTVLRKPIVLPGRMESIRTVNGIKYINDTTATTPEATMMALKTLKSKVILIAGGADKGLSFKVLAGELARQCQTLVLLEGVGTEKIKKELKLYDIRLPVAEVKNMPDAIGVAQSFAKKGDTILLSPACASFGMFVNEFDRGDKFVKIVENL